MRWAIVDVFAFVKVRKDVLGVETCNDQGGAGWTLLLPYLFQKIGTGQFKGLFGLFRFGCNGCRPVTVLLLR